jgi:hypothetical protein
MSVLDQIQNGSSQVWEKLNDRGLEGCNIQNLKQAIKELPILQEKLSILAVKSDGTPDVSAWKPDNQFDGGDGYNYKEKFSVKDNKPERYQLIRWKTKGSGGQATKAVFTTAMIASFRLGQEQELNTFLEEHLKAAPQRIVDVEQHVIDIERTEVGSSIPVMDGPEPGNEETGQQIGDVQAKFIHKGQTIVYTALVKQRV